MQQAENVVSFPVDRMTTDLLRDFIGKPNERLDEVVYRLSGIEAVLFLVRHSPCNQEFRDKAVMLMETAVRDCIVIAELRPVA